eukprot:4536494-Pyramimonas_sp.AAC.1
MPRGIASIREVGSTEEGPPSGGLLERLRCFGELLGLFGGASLGASWRPLGPLLEPPGRLLGPS